MARYTGPVCRLCRRAGEKLFLKGERCATPKCSVEKRNYPPGQRQARRRKMSDRGVQLREKQKAKAIYGVLERQFWKHFEEAERRPGVTGHNLLQILEMRLDNVVYRMGFADSRNQARQIVRHGHIIVNGRRTNIPSFMVKQGDAITWREVSTKGVTYQDMSEKMKNRFIPPWLSVDMANMSGAILHSPVREEIDIHISEQTIVEYYSR